jgi:hypothetical protein
MRERGSMTPMWVRTTFLVALAVLSTAVSHAKEEPRVPVNRQIEGLSLGMPMREVPAMLRRQVPWIKERAVLCLPDGRRPSAATGPRDCFETVLDTTEFQTADSVGLKLVFLQSRLLRIELEPRTDTKVMQAALVEKYGPPQQETYWHFEWGDGDTLLQFSKRLGGGDAPTRLIYTDRALLRAEGGRLARERTAGNLERERLRQQAPKSY